ncbi:Dolichyl-diphosphooligosaccharide-protein glycosyltransferase subunit dad1 [Irineochytrium annulatum]|nr:Dolichyl-diphosphooligosaccharide-protein glycosyltransferase subunit dad1 [Irineochytrium annulatum]
MPPKKVVAATPGSTPSRPPPSSSAASTPASTTFGLKSKDAALVANPRLFIQQQSGLVQKVLSSYQETTPRLLKLIDAYLAFVMMTGVAQFAYVVVAGTYPYNSFLSGFIASVGAFVLAANLRIQLNPLNDMKISPEA